MSRITRANRFALLCGASALTLSVLAAPSFALAQDAVPAATSQDDESTEVDEIVVTGIRASLASAQSIKRNSDQFVDSITAVDIGRLPDINVAEALQRISGVQISRDRGEGNGIAIRGLTQVRTELNGRDIFSANGGRGLSWEEVGSDLLAGVDVYKNPSADLIEGGLSGTVNLRTRMPFDASGRIISASGAYTYYDLADDYGKTLSGLISDRFDTSAGEIGVLLNLSYGDTSFGQEKAVVEPFWERTDIPGYEGLDNIFVPAGGGVYYTEGARERKSAAFALQWRPNDSTEFYLQALRTEYNFDETGLSYFAYGPNSSGGAMTAVPGTFTIGDDGVAITGAYQNPNVDAVTFASSRETSTTDISLGGKWRPIDRLEISGDLQYIKSDVALDTINLTASVLSSTGSVPGFGGDWTFGFDLSDEIPRFTATDGYLADPNNYGLTAILPYREQNDAESWAGRLDMTWDFDEGGFFKNVSVGVRATDRSAVNRTTTYGTWTGVGSCANWSSAANCIVLGDYPDQVQLNDGVAGNIRGSDLFGPVAFWTVETAKDSQAAFDFVNGLPLGLNIGFRDFDDPNAVIGDIAENTYAGYGVVRFGATTRGIDWSGNLGLRWVKVESTSNGFQTLNYRDPDFVSDGVSTPSTITLRTSMSGSQEYDELLPSLNLKANLTDQLILRFAVSKNMSPPSFSQLNSTFSISPAYQNAGDVVPTGVGTGTSNGNALLKPEKVTQYDMALEWYFSPIGYLYGTVFKKDITDLIFSVSNTETYDLTGSNGTVLADQPFLISRLVNLDEGSVEGFEVGGQYFFDFLPGAFSGLGFQANYTFVDSNASTIAASDITGGSSIDVPLVGLSENSYNLILLYEKYGVNARLAYNWRDDWLVTTQSNGTGNLPIFAKEYGTLDASISYDFNPSVALTIDAQNLTNEAYRSYQGVESRPRDYQIDDRRFSVRLRVRY